MKGKEIVADQKEVSVGQWGPRNWNSDKRQKEEENCKGKHRMRAQCALSILADTTYIAQHQNVFNYQMYYDSLWNIGHMIKSKNITPNQHDHRSSMSHLDLHRMWHDPLTNLGTGAMRTVTHFLRHLFIRIKLVSDLMRNCTLLTKTLTPERDYWGAYDKRACQCLISTRGSV